jgi:hypothetical protein
LRRIELIARRASSDSHSVVADQVFASNVAFSVSITTRAAAQASSSLRVIALTSELWRILGDEADQAALCTGIGMTSVPS